jgi:hypothetical protein
LIISYWIKAGRIYVWIKDLVDLVVILEGDLKDAQWLEN